MAKNYRINIRRTLPNGEEQTATYNLEHVHSNLDDAEQAQLLFDIESSVMGEEVGETKTLRVWFQEADNEGYKGLTL